ncbi:MAG: DUF5615 family PIN-like protein [Salibacteraceae bacterium]
MKLLLDQNISYRVALRLSHVYSDIKHISQLGLENGSDTTIWLYARTHNYLVVSFDSDFYDLSLVWGSPPKII